MKNVGKGVYFLMTLLTVSVLLAGCAGPYAAMDRLAYPGDQPTEPWWRHAVFYEIFVRSFYDSDGDGIGDLNGITQKLDYLNDGNPATGDDLGVTALWLMPIHPSPSYHGYDVIDYRAVNPDYGSMEDFQALLTAAHDRGIRVIIDMVINHTSNQHEWFQASNAGDAAYRDYYIWSDEDPGYNGPWGQDVWYSGQDGYYYAVFWDGMPDLNAANPTVQQEIFDVADFWLNEVGVDGFRMDGAKHIIEEGQVQENSPATHTFLKAYNAHVKSTAEQALVVGEVWSPSTQVAEYVTGGELDLAFNFELAEAMVSAATFADASRISNTLTQQSRAFDGAPYAAFLTNHDQNRVMSALNGDVDKARLAATLLLTAPGTPFLYYGEEIGMTGSKPDPNIRKPMQWAPDELGGFTTGTPWTTLNGDISLRNVEDALKDDASLLRHYQRLIHLRSGHPALRVGDVWQVQTGQRSVYASLRTYEDEALLVVVNLGKSPVSEVKLRWEESPLSGTYQAVSLLGEGKPYDLTTAAGGSLEETLFVDEMPGYSSWIFVLQPAN